MDYPEYVSRFYDVIYKEVNSGEDVRFYLEQIMKTNGSVLEVGSGTGRLFLKALDQGADIYGLDISQSMLGVLKSKLQPGDHHRLSNQSITDFTLSRKFDLIVAPFRVFMHLLTVEDQLKALNNVGNHLTANGLFIFDVFVPNLKMLTEGVDNAVDYDGEYAPGKRLKRITSVKSDLILQCSNVKMSFIWDDSEGNQLNETWDFQMRYYFRYELEHLIARSKLNLVEIAGDFKGNPLGNKSGEFVVICNIEAY